MVGRLGMKGTSVASDLEAAWDALPSPPQASAVPSVPRPDGEVDPETPFMVIYTSGTPARRKAPSTSTVASRSRRRRTSRTRSTCDRATRCGWITDLGWMMGPWAISGALLLGARLVLFEGAPDYPDPGRTWRLIERHRITHIGHQPDADPGADGPRRRAGAGHDLSTLRVLGSTGEPWNPDPWWWLFRVVGGGRVPIVNYTGGTEIAGGILAATALRPIRPISFNGPCLGMAADVLDPTAPRWWTRWANWRSAPRGRA